MKPRLQLLVISILATGFAPLASIADIVTLNFLGGVSSVYNPYNAVATSLIRVGDPVQVSLRFDTTTPDGYPDDPKRGSFLSAGWLKMNINGLAFERAGSVLVDILHGSNGGQEFFQAMALGDPTAWPDGVPAYPYQRIGMAFWETGPPYDFLSNAELPTFLDFSRADIRNGSISTGTDSLNMYEVQFNLVQVPEPSAAILLAVGMLLCCQMYQARSRHLG